MEHHRKKGTENPKNPITGGRDFVPVSRNVMFDDKKKLWIQQRKRNYYYWFRCLQLCLKDNREVQMSKYRGWGSKTEILNSKFDDFWKKNWANLFGFKKHPKTRVALTHPKFKLEREIVGLEQIAIRLSILIHEELLKKNHGTSIDIAERLHKSEYKKGWYKHAHLFDTDHYRDSDKGRDGIKAVKNNIDRYKRKGKLIIKNVCNGTYP